MEQGLKAFFYDYKYYLLPDDCADTEDVKKISSREFRRLKEEKCMAPDFVYEAIETEFLSIEAPERVFPVKVNLYSRQEYDGILAKQVEKRCPGCARYTDDGSEELNGHHRELSLAGVCYSREEEDSPLPFARAAVYFWEIIARSINELAEMTDRGDQKGINKLLNRTLSRFFLPLDFYGGVEDGRYCLCMSGDDYPVQGVRAIVKMLSDTANHAGSAMDKAGWKVYPYFPKGIYVPKLRPDYFRHPPKIFCSESDGGVEIVFYEKGAESWGEKKTAGRKRALYRYLCHYAGENLLLAASSSIAVAEKLPADKQEIRVEDLAELLQKRATEMFEEGIPFPSPVYFQTEGIGENALPFKEETRTWMTVCCEMTPEQPTEKREFDNTIFEPFGIVYAYIYLPGRFLDGLDAWKKEVWDWYFYHAEEYPEPIVRKEDWESFAKNVGIIFSPKGICTDCMVFDEQEFFRILKHLAPVLEGLSAKIVTVKKDGVLVYDPGYVIRPEDSGLCS